MTVERASEIVSALREAPDTGTKEYELFEHFLDYFGFTSPEKQVWFANLCGFDLARLANEIEDEEPEG